MFMYNGLKSIYALCNIGAPTSIKKMLSSINTSTISFNIFMPITATAHRYSVTMSNNDIPTSERSVL